MILSAGVHVMHSSLRLRVVVILLATIGSGRAAETLVSLKRANSYDSPEKAFESYVAAVRNEDGNTACESLTRESLGSPHAVSLHQPVWISPPSMRFPARL